MALFHPGPIASDIRGSMGGTVFSRNRSGMYIRRRVVPVNPMTASQTDVRDNVSALQAYFRDTMLQPARDLWTALANATTAKNKVGLGITLTAQNVFIKINSLRLACGLTILAVAPVPPAGTSAPAITVTGAVATGLQVTAVLPLPIAGSCFFLQRSPALNQTVNFYKGPWAPSIRTSGVLTLPIQLIPAASMAIGQRYHWRFRVLDATGHISNYITGITDITT